ncbi:hypothetical protein [Corynebacterium striatum]|uniref:hypothetical protein n=1 Tax=Corynebacterium striatum TaxID=43770 RepID=UPI003F814FA6
MTKNYLDSPSKKPLDSVTKNSIDITILGLIAAFLFLSIVLGAAAYFLLSKDTPDAPADTVSTPTSTAPTTMSDVPSENV